MLDEHLVSLQAPSTAAAEQYRVLRHFVETLRKRANLQVLGVTSASVGDGKTVTAINLAGALSQSDDTRVLLVDMDLRRPSVARYLAITETRRTLADALGAPGLALKDAVVHLTTSYLYGAGGPAVTCTSGALVQKGRPFVHGYEIFLEKATLLYQALRNNSGSFATLAATRRASTVLLLWHCVVEFSVVEQQTTLRRNAGDVLVAMMPADVARGIGVTRMEQLGRGVIKAADIEH